MVAYIMISPMATQHDPSSTSYVYWLCDAEVVLVCLGSLSHVVQSGYSQSGDSLSWYLASHDILCII